MRILYFLISRVLRALLPQNAWGDKVYAYIRFCQRLGRRPRRVGSGLNDTLFRLKTDGTLLDPLRQYISDKEYVKIFIAGTVGSQYAVPTIAVLRNPQAVQNYVFPDRCCIKPTHTSGNVIIRRNGEPIDKREIQRWFRINYYAGSREQNYKYLIPKVIVEPLIFDNENVEDYKFHCFNGNIKFIQVDIDRHTEHRRAFFDNEWNKQPFSMLYPIYKEFIDIPENMSDMKYIVQKISQYFGVVRVDLYSNGQHCYIGEITNCHGSGGEPFVPRDAESIYSPRFVTGT
jgi:hypothetical protein